MKRRQWIQQGGLAGILAAGTAPAFAQGLPEVRWRLTSSFPKTLDTLFGAADNVAKRVLDATGGKFQIKTFAAGEIVPGLQVLDAVQNASVEAGQTAMYYYFGKNPAFAFATCLPFGMNARQQNAWWYYGGGEELYNEFLKPYNCYAIPYGNTGTQMGGWFRKEIKTVNDLKGLKFRVGGVAGQILLRLGWCRNRSRPVTFTPHWKKARLMPPSGSARTTMTGWASPRWPSITTPRAGGKATLPVT